MAGVPVGEEIPDLIPCVAATDPALLPARPRCAGTSTGSPQREDAGADAGADAGEDAGADAGQGSIIIVVATDAPLLPHQLDRLVKRAALGVGRMGGRGENSSGDIFVAFSTANPRTAGDTGTVRVEMLPNARINPLFAATVQATEEAILNAMLAAETMTGADELRVFALPRDRLLEAMRKYGRGPRP